MCLVVTSYDATFATGAKASWANGKDIHVLTIATSDFKHVL
jgi:hypothetical protein